MCHCIFFRINPRVTKHHAFRLHGTTVGTLTNQKPASSACKVHKACKVSKARKAHKAHKARKACKVSGKKSGFYVNEVVQFH